MSGPQQLDALWILSVAFPSVQGTPCFVIQLTTFTEVFPSSSCPLLAVAGLRYGWEMALWITVWNSYHYPLLQSKRKLVFCFGHKIIFQTISVRKFFFKAQLTHELYELAVVTTLRAPAVSADLCAWLIFLSRRQRQFCWVSFNPATSSSPLVYLKVYVKQQCACVAEQDICSLLPLS